MYNMVRVMLGPPEWKCKTITLPDAPNDPQMFYYHDIEKCTHYPLQQPDLAEHMEYVLMEVHSMENDDHTCHEMCSAHEWNKQQVSKNTSNSMYLNIHSFILKGSVENWDDNP